MQRAKAHHSGTLGAVPVGYIPAQDDPPRCDGSIDPEDSFFFKSTDKVLRRLLS